MSEIDTEDYPYWNATHPAPRDKDEETAMPRQVAAGHRMPAFTLTCPKAVWELATACLALNPKDRPSAIEVVYAIEQLRRRVRDEDGDGEEERSHATTPS
ncbi:hypothetical protein PsorP6_007949 [Peronosclerospora sorghi]|uniref:Uncharacterized protein n=1 Tax=Peronosclerospora sorghi TaxID=230839 RepID=A0ACC0W8P2_9STRA|nr:hypothetical protein PsorP6_007949 [Peronosclerospora sorghi]